MLQRRSFLLRSNKSFGAFRSFYLKHKQDSALPFEKRF
jgi:hypothetical protein